MLDKAQGGDGAKLVALAREATQAAEAVLADAALAVRRRVTADDRMVDALLDREQRATHGLAWLATYVESVRQLAAYAERMHARGVLGEIEELIVEIGIGEYLAQNDIGRLKMADWLEEEAPVLPPPSRGLGNGSCHHMCTTRMSDDPRTGVVDRDCRVHGMRNLYVGGSSVFATACSAGLSP